MKILPLKESTILWRPGQTHTMFNLHTDNVDSATWQTQVNMQKRREKMVISCAIGRDTSERLRVVTDQGPETVAGLPSDGDPVLVREQRQEKDWLLGPQHVQRRPEEVPAVAARALASTDRILQRQPPPHLDTHSYRHNNGH